MSQELNEGLLHSKQSLRKIALTVKEECLRILDFNDQYEMNGLCTIGLEKLMERVYHVVGKEQFLKYVHTVTFNTSLTPPTHYVAVIGGKSSWEDAASLFVRGIKIDPTIGQFDTAIEEVVFGSEDQYPLPIIEGTIRYDTMIKPYFLPRLFSK